MKFNIPKIIRPLEMNEYDEAMAGLSLQVWVNPPRGVHRAYWQLQIDLKKLAEELNDLLKPEKPNTKKITELNESIDKANNDVFAWFADILSQSSNEEMHVTVEELRDMADEDPALWKFMTQGSMKLIRKHQDNIRKN